jgi:hypothetical protein
MVGELSTASATLLATVWVWPVWSGAAAYTRTGATTTTATTTSVELAEITDQLLEKGQFPARSGSGAGNRDDLLSVL